MLHKPIDWACGDERCQGKQFCEYCLNLSGDHLEAVWPCESSVEVSKLVAENLTLFGENIDLIRQRDHARDIAIRCGAWQNGAGADYEAHLDRSQPMPLVDPDGLLFGGAS